MDCGHTNRHQLNKVILCWFSISVFLLTFQNTAFALGLGDIHVQSSLGEPLQATIKVFGAKDLKDASCLRLGLNSDIQGINFKLGPKTGDTAILSLSNKSPVNEPITNLFILAGCNTSFERHYILLLDPPELSTKSEDIITSSVAPTSSSLENTVPPKSKKQSSASSKTNSKKKVAKRSSRNQLSQLRPQAVITPATKNETPKANNNHPNDAIDKSKSNRLSISGSPLYFDSKPQLQLDKALNINANTNLSTTMAESIVLDDELTVVNNRITHLQKQVAKLEQQNLKLATVNELKTKQLTQAESLEIRFRNILLLILAILLLLVAYLLFAWLRRKQLENQTNNTQALWTNTTRQEEAKPELNTSATEETENTEDKLPEKPEGGLSQQDELSQNDELVPFTSATDHEHIVVEEDDQAFSVLDHADVFLFHGRAALAIQLLQNYLIDYPKQSVTIWLFMLDLLAKENLKTEYEQASKDCILYYNINIRDFSEKETRATESLEDFPRLVQGLCDVWDTPNALVYLDDLIYNRRPKPRAGLPRNIIEELATLKAIALETINLADATLLDKKKEDANKVDSSFEFKLIDK